MKKRTTFIHLLTCLFFVCSVLAQEAKDLILTTDYKMIEAHVILVGDTRIQYKLPGEDRINELSVEKIIKIKFADGKEHLFKKPEKKAKPPKKNKEDFTVELPPFDKDLVAVIPFDFYDDKTGKSIGKKGLEVQRYIERKLTNQTSLHVLDARETNARLMAARVDYTRLEFYPISKLAEYLGAGTIITGSVRFTFEEQVFANEYYVENEPELVVDESIGVNRHGELEYTAELYEVSTGGNWYVDFNKYKTFETVTSLQVYQEGRKIFDKERDPLFKWGMQDDWEGNVEWLLKKSPFKLPRTD